MTSKISGILIVILALALVGGTGYILLRPETAESRQIAESQRGTNETESGGYRGGRAEEALTGTGRSSSNETVGTQGQGQGQGIGRSQDSDSGSSTQLEGAQGRGQSEPGSGQGKNRSDVSNSDPTQTVSGKVLEADNDVILATESGEVLVGMGPSAYRDSQSFMVSVGDSLEIEGYYEDGEFKASNVENRTTGQAISLRDATGRPMWAGQGRRQGG